VEALRENRDHIHVFAFAEGRRPAEALIASSLDSVRPSVAPPRRRAPAIKKAMAKRPALSRPPARSRSTSPPPPARVSPRVR
jgi:hypothetical protein